MLFEPLFAHARTHPQELAMIDDFGQWTYQQVASMSAGLGMYISMQTDKPHVGILLPPSAGFAASFYGTLLASKSIVPINYLLGDREIAHVIQDSGIDTVITIPQLAPRLKDARLNVIALLIFVANFYLRTTGGSRLVTSSYMIAVLLSVLGVVLITISGWLGGEMVYRHGVAVSSGSGATPEKAGTQTKVRAA